MSDMTLRDRFAMAALHGLAADRASNSNRRPAVLAEVAYDVADAMLRAREQGAVASPSEPADPPAIHPGKQPMLMEHRSTQLRIEWFDTDWSRGRAAARAIVKFFGAPAVYMDLSDLYRDFQVVDDDSWGAAFSIYAAHAHGCKVCKAIDDVGPVPTSPCDAGLPLWREYVRRFDALAERAR